jgi:flagellar biosynthesis chaperone FliJ
MKKKSLSILHRYRNHLLERDQVNLQEKIADENVQKARLLQLQARVKAAHEAKAGAKSVEELKSLDEAAAYLHSRMTLARRAISLTAQAREEAMAQAIRTKQARDQVATLIEKGKAQFRREHDLKERNQIDDLTTARYAMGLGGA